MPERTDSRRTPILISLSPKSSWEKKVDKKKFLMLIGFQDSTLEAHIVIFNTYFINTTLVPKSPPVMKTT